MDKKLLLLTTILIGGLAAAFVVKDFSIPLSSANGGDTDFWEYMGYYVYNNISFLDPRHFLLPNINFVNNQHLYPFGTNNALQGWALESTLWYALFYNLFGNWGNWLGYYYVVASVVPFLGAYYLLNKEIEPTKAFVVAIMVSLFNFYALQRYPYHFSHTVHHWLTLCLIVDFVLFKRFYEHKSVSLRLVLSKIVLLILVLGLEVGYIIGLALASTVITVLVAAVVLIFRKRDLKSTVSHFGKVLTAYAEEARSNKKKWLPLAGLIVVFGYLYIPLVGQLFLEVKKFPHPFAHGNWWVNPLRLLLPIFENPASEFYQSLMRDSTEGLLQGTVGWFLLSLAAIGFVKNVKIKSIAHYAPLLILLVLCVLFHPRLLPTLKIFPWFEYARVPGRSTIIYPTIMALLAIPAIEWPHKKLRKIVVVIIAAIGCFELSVNYHSQYQRNNYSFDNDFRAYMQVVRETPGEAVFDYPFCIVGGNGVGGEENLAPLFAGNSHVSTMQRFHQKKTVGHYYGRLNKFQIKNQVDLGWGTLMEVAAENSHEPQKLSTCLSAFQFEQLVKFIKYNDFSGLNIYTDLLPNIACEQQFIKTFGKPVDESEIVGLGRAIFIPKPEEWYSEINFSAGRKVSFTEIETFK